MRVILTERVASLGNVGEIVKVSAGHARNFLFPQKLAVVADESNKSVLEDQQRRLQKKINQEKEKAAELKTKIEQVNLEYVRRIGGNGKIFGSVTSSEMAKELVKQGIDVDRRQIVITEPLKGLGSFELEVQLVKGVSAKFKVQISQDPKQIEEEKNKKKSKKAKAEADEAAAKEKAESESESESEEQGEQEGTEE